MRENQTELVVVVPPEQATTKGAPNFGSFQSYPQNNNDPEF